MSSTRSEHPTLGYLPQSSTGLRAGTSPTNTSPTEGSGGSALRSPFGLAGSMNTAGKMASNSRSGAGSPSHELGSGPSRIYSKRLVEAWESVRTFH